MEVFIVSLGKETACFLAPWQCGRALEEYILAVNCADSGSVYN